MADNLKLKMVTHGDKNSKVTETPTNNSITPEAKPQRHDLPRRHKWLTGFGLAILVVLLLLSPLIVAGVIFKKAGVGGFTQAAKSFLFSKDSEIQSQNGRVNLLILGIGGKGHAGPDLTDTMIFASISLTGGPAELISIPRDIWIPEIRSKINSAYYWGETQPERGGDLNFSKQVVTEVTGQPVNYALVIDFSGFQDIIDTIGGVDVTVDRSFTDTKYPITGRENDLCNGDPTLACRYMTIHFDKGVTHMDGITALEFVRSREGDNGENTDFARSARQQKVISAAGKKVLSINTILNPAKDYKILATVKASVETDLTPNAIGVLGRVILKSKNNMNSSVLSTDLLVNPPVSAAYDQQYVLIPKAGNGKWQEIQAWVKSLLN